MKTLFSLLNLFLCLELIVAPVAPNLSLLGQKAMADEGSCQTGFQWDSTLNRCLTSTETANVMNAVASCAAGDVQCYRSNAEAALKTKESSGEMPATVADKGGMAKAMNAAAVAAPLGLAAYTLMTKKKGTSCKAYSLYAMIAAGGALFAGDIIANMKHKKRLKDIEKDWSKIVNEGAADETNKDNQKTNATEAQSQAFEMLARSEDSMAAAAKMKSIFNATAMAAFAAVAAWSTYETIDLAKAKSQWIIAKANAATAPAAVAPAYANYMNKYQKYTCNNEKAKDDVGESALAEEKIQNDLDAQRSKMIEEEMKSTPPSGGFIFWNSNSYRISQHNIKSAPNLAAFHVLLNERENLNFRNSSPSIDEYEEMTRFFNDFNVNDNKDLLSLMKETIKTIGHNLNPISNSYAQDANLPGATEESVSFLADMRARLSKIPSSVKNVLKNIDKNLKTPVTRAVISGVFAGWAGVMYAHTKKQQKASEERAKLLRKMKEEFNIASGAINMCSAEDRNNTAKPECYCYTSEGGRNANRSNSQICQRMFAGINTTAGNYYGTSGASMKGCISNTNTFDATCSCKANNSCLKASASGNFSGMNPGTFSMLSSPLQAIDGISNGSIDTANVNGDAAVNNAMRIMDATDKLQNAKGAEEVKKAKAGAKALEDSLIRGASGMSPNLGNSSSSGLASLSPKEAAAMLEKELESPSIGPVGGGSDAFSPIAGSGGDDTQLDFGLSGTQASDPSSQVAEVMKENFDYGQNDINEGSSTNIFEVLSNRYQRSGMRRLFDEKGKTKADAPAKTDINK